MAEITLQKYLSRLEGLLKQGRYDEAAAHCRHILSKYPHNAAARHLLAKALARAGQHAEARAEYERVLSVYPDDASAYAGLARVAQGERRTDDALALMMRAYDLDPSDASVTKELRELYAKRYGDPNMHLPQGVYTSANQQAKASLYHRAIETLQTAVEEHETRYDLRALLIDVLQSSGDLMGAGKAALDLLKVLPYCAVANRVMAQLWLSQERPSDAQRYVGALEAVDPYAAFELVQGAAVPDNILMLAELDYESEAQRQLVNVEPDWLGSLEDSAVDLGLDSSFEPVDSEPVEEDIDWLSEINEVQRAADLPTRAVQMPQEMPDNDDLAALLGDAPADAGDASRPTGTGFTGLLRALEDEDAPLDDAQLESLWNDESPLPSSGTGLTGLLMSLDEEVSRETEQIDPALLDEMQNLLPPTPQIETLDSLSAADEDPMAWLRGEDIELLETSQQAPIDDDPFGALGELEQLSDPHADDPMAWLKDEGIELLDSDQLDAMDDDADSMAWLRGSDPLSASDSQIVSPTEVERPMFGGATFPRDSAPKFEESLFADDEEADDLFGTVGTEDDDLFAAASDQPDPMAWLKDEGIPLIDDDAALEDSLDWMKDPETPVANSELPASANTDNALDLFADLEPFDADGEEIMASDFDWNKLQNDDDDNMQDDNLEWLSADDESALDLPGQTAANAPLFSEETAQPQSLSSDDVGGALSWLNSDDDSADDDDLLDLSDSEPVEADLPDWLVSMQVDEGGEEADDADALTPSTGDDAQAEPEAEPEEEPVSESAAMPDWLAAMNADETQDDEMMAVTDDTLFDEEAVEYTLDDDEAEAEEAGDGLPDWLSAIGPSTQAEPQAELDDSELDDEFDALFPRGATSEQGTFGAELTEEEFDFMGGAEDDALAGEDESEELEGEAMPDWLAAVGASSQPELETEIDDEDVDEDEDAFDAIFGTTPLPVSEASVASGELDDVLFGAEDTLDESDNLIALDDEELEAEAMPDWLAAMQSTDASEAVSVGAQADDDSEDDFDFLMADEEEELVDDGEENIIPDWLSTSENPALTAEAPAEETPDWLEAIGSPSSTQQDDFEVEDEEPDWMSEMIGEERAVTASTDGGFDFEADSDLDGGAEVTPDWLSGAAVETPAAMNDEDLLGQFDEDADLLDADEFAVTEEITLAPAENAPDFLNAMVPGLDVDTSSQELDEPLEAEYLEDAEEVQQQTDYAWVAAIVDEELRPPASLPTSEVPAVNLPRRRFEFSQPPAWLQKLRGGRTASKASEDELPDWLDFDDDTN